MDLVKKIVKGIKHMGGGKKHKHGHRHKRKHKEVHAEPKSRAEILKEILDKEEDEEKREYILERMLDSISHEVDSKGGVYGMDGDTVAAIMSYYLEDDIRYKKIMEKTLKKKNTFVK